ncbi:hypothetical protein HGRIS_004469 [Hohenbuehelia grisea]|uniref:NodB homology domain-containing protein n=1 Tax=Hohenbuehelia grisea TaxID=104357 RepID=A0ABR3JDN3_9AGAR
MLAPFFVTAALALVTVALPEKRELAQVISSCTVPNTAALTFDDGPHLYTYDVVKALDAEDAKGTFFFNGDNMGCIYSEDNRAAIKHLYNQGHQVASHTWRHADLSKLSWDGVNEEMARVDTALHRIVGVKPRFMRPPYGSYNDVVRDVSAHRGQIIAIWDLDSRDSMGASPWESKQIYNEMVDRRPSTILALNHETYERTANDVLPHAIRRLKNAGYRLVTLAECLGEEPYQTVDRPQEPDDDWHC